MGVDLSDHDLFAEREPHEVFDRLRAAAPVAWNPEPNGRAGFWAVTRYRDVLAVLRDPQTFSNAAGGISLEEPAPDELAARRNFLELDPPEHGRFRKELGPHFTPKAVGVWEAWLRELTVGVLDDVLPRRTFDVLDEIAAPIPIRVLGHIMGIPDEHHHRLVELSDKLLNNNDPALATVLADSPESDPYRLLPFRSPEAQEIIDLGRDLFAVKRHHPSDDVISYMVNATPDGGAYSQHELEVNFVMMVVAGNETTRSAMARGIQAFCEHPDQWDLLRSRPDLLAGAVDEIVRYSSPVWHFRRTATRDTELAGETIRAGDKVVVWFGSANRDETVFPNPHRFDITRPPSRNTHASFGRGGPHFCLGAHLATLEIRVLVEELMRRVVHWELAGPVVRVRSNFANGFRSLPVRVTLA